MEYLYGGITFREDLNSTQLQHSFVDQTKSVRRRNSCWIKLEAVPLERKPVPIDDLVVLTNVLKAWQTKLYMMSRFSKRTSKQRHCHRRGIW
jgi:hypothetical protein